MTHGEMRSLVALADNFSADVFDFRLTALTERHIIKKHCMDEGPCLDTISASRASDLSTMSMDCSCRIWQSHARRRVGLRFDEDGTQSARLAQLVCQGNW